MQVEFKVSDLFTVVAEGNTHKEVFTNLAGLSEVFSVSECGKCKSTNVLPVKRVVDEVGHYELKCKDCNSKLTFGQNKKGDSLYPRRKYHDKHRMVQQGQAAEGDWIPNNGWEDWSGERNDDGETVGPAKGRATKGR